MKLGYWRSGLFPHDAMSGEVKSDVELEIAHVLFIDTVGYSKRLINEQRELLTTLNKLVRSTKHFRDAEAAGKLIRLPTGDGMALVFSDSPETPVQCAIELSKAVRARPELPLRMGIHSGPVSRVVDVNDRENVAGAGINTAQRVMNCGDAGHILLSKRAADDLTEYQHWHQFLHEIGECEVKHGTKIHLVNLYTGEAGNPEVPAGCRRPGGRLFARASSKVDGSQQRPNRARSVLVGAVALAVFAGLISYLAFFRTRSLPPSPPGPFVSEKSIAVLPFENLSDDKQNAYFADGVQDQILTNLAKVADLKVISRTSVMQYRTDFKRNLRQIAAELGVAHVLEGTVQRVGGRVRISAQLIDARTDSHLWATSFDRTLADVFVMQSEVAETIVAQLKIKLSSAEKAAIEEKPTANLVAYDRYMRAKVLIGSTVFSAHERENLFEAVRALEDAVTRDPEFLRAHCQLARVHDKIYILGLDHTPQRAAMAEASIENAVRLRPESGEVHLAVANHRYSVYLDYDGARRELAKAKELLPNEPLSFELAGFIDRRQGRWKESTYALLRALELDPRNVYLLQQLSLSYEHMRRFSDMAITLDQALSVEPNDPSTRAARGIVDLEWRADPEPLLAAIQDMLAKDPNIASEVAESWLYGALCKHDWSLAEKALAATKTGVCKIENVAFPHSWCVGILARAQGNKEAAHAAFMTARRESEKIVREQPQFGEALCVLGMIDAALGMKEQAVDEGRRAVQLVPIERDAINGPLLLQYLAVIYAWTGDKERAVAQLVPLATMPSTINFGFLRLHPYWDPLRGDPRFEELVASLASKSPGDRGNPEN